MARKWIVASDIATGELEFRSGNVDLHKDLIPQPYQPKNVFGGFQSSKPLDPTHKCIGGGYWDFEPTDKSLTLYSSSFDFGQCNIEDVKKAVSESRISPYVEKILFTHHQTINEALDHGPIEIIWTRSEEE